ncbi:MAG: DUF1295 domain-containing protein [Ruminococcaceae bacterium]|nr:DUF1295 domain-containing protein [Oscillospiraceae bacterium]
MRRIKENRTISYIIITIIYVIATVAAVLTYNALTFEWWLRLLVADIVATVITFAFSLIFSNASVYDPYWSVQPIVILTALAVGKALTPMRIMLLFVVYIWGIRLTVNWAYTFPNLSHQDWRYTMLKKKTGVFYPIINFVGIHMVPTLVVWGCVLPAAYVFLFDVVPTRASVFCILLSIAATIMQGVADLQMHKFRKNRNGAFIRSGLWKHSRHPNYLGEILMWWGIALSVISADSSAVILCLGAAANTLLFLFVSIPLADGRQSAKPGFDEYKNETRMLLPIKRFK